MAENLQQDLRAAQFMDTEYNSSCADSSILNNWNIGFQTQRSIKKYKFSFCIKSTSVSIVKDETKKKNKSNKL